MTSQSTLLALLSALGPGLACLSFLLVRRARRAEAAAERAELLLTAVADSASAVAASESPLEAATASLERIGLRDVRVLVFDEPSGQWLVRAGEAGHEPLGDLSLACKAQRAWDRQAALAHDGAGPGGSVLSCPVPAAGGISVVLIASGQVPASPAELAAVRAAAGLLGASGLSFERSLPDRDVEHRAAQGPVDSLTGLATATVLMAALEERCRSGRSAVAVLLVAVDGLEAITDEFGGRSGDEVLRIAARRLRRCLRPDDLLVRVDPTVFGILLADAADPDGATVVGDRALEALATPVAVTAGSVRVTARVGLVWDATGKAEPTRVLPEVRDALSRSHGQVVRTIKLGEHPAMQGRPHR